MKESFPQKVNKEEAKKKYIELYKDDPDFNLEEFEFNQQRFESKAEKYLERGLFKRILDGNAEKDATAFSYDEALRDNAEWNKMYHLELQENGTFEKEMNTEYKEWHKMLEVVLENIKKKRDDPNGEGKEIRPLLLVLGGGMAGSYGMGQLSALSHAGYMEGTFKQAVGISAGACDLTYALAGKDQSLIGASCYYEECTEDRFLVIDPVKLIKDPKRIKQVMDVSYMSEIMEGVVKDGSKKLDLEAVQKNSTEFYIQATDVTDSKNPQAEFLNAKEKGVIECVHASMALPWFYRKSIEIDGKQYQDGAILESFPIEEIIKKFNPTDILVLPQVPFDNMVGVEKDAKFSRMLARFIPNRASLKTGSATLLKKFIQSKEGQREALSFIQEQTGVKIGIMYPPDGGMLPITNDGPTVKAGVLAAAKKTCEELGEKMNFKLK